VVEEVKIVDTEEEMETNKTMTRTMIGKIMIVLVIVLVVTTALQIGKVVVVGMIEAKAVGLRVVVDTIRETTGTTKGHHPLLVAEVVCRNAPGPIAL
jgi:UDP-N-acetylmuramyl pentapeptide phosphotransferase/UDP-N-acetylglucosamine-1-phosphate transferase